MADNEMTDYAVFMVKGEEIRVPALTFYTLDENRGRIEKLDPNLDWMDYAGQVLMILIRVTEPDDPQKQQELFNNYRRRMTIPEMRNLTTALSDLLKISGFIMTEGTESAEAPTLPTETQESLGIGTPIPSQLN